MVFGFTHIFILAEDADDRLSDFTVDEWYTEVEPVYVAPLFIFPVAYATVPLFVSVVLPTESLALPLDSSNFQYDTRLLVSVIVYIYAIVKNPFPASKSRVNVSPLARVSDEPFSKKDISSSFVAVSL